MQRKLIVVMGDIKSGFVRAQALAGKCSGGQINIHVYINAIKGGSRARASDSPQV